VHGAGCWRGGGRASGVRAGRRAHVQNESRLAECPSFSNAIEDEPGSSFSNVFEDESRFLIEASPEHQRVERGQRPARWRSGVGIAPSLTVRSLALAARVGGLLAARQAPARREHEVRGVSESMGRGWHLCCELRHE
jgi:hypothetical protein